MKVLVSADWHLNLRQKGVPLDWARNRYKILFKEIESKSAKVDIHLLLGDVFDKIPSLDELELFFEYITNTSMETYIIGGNHEQVKRNTTFLTNLKSVVRALNSKVTIIDDYYTKYGIDFIPYNKLKDKWPDTLNSTILASHCRGEILPHVKAEIDLTLFDKWQTVLVGDLHSHANSQYNLLYPGSPVTTSFHRTPVDTGVIIFDTDTHKYTWERLETPQLIRKTIKAGDPMPTTDYDHTVYEVFGSMDELGVMENSDLLDKKVVSRSNDTTLILDAAMTLLEEVEEYARFILQLGEPAIQAMLKELNNHIGELEE